MVPEHDSVMLWDLLHSPDRQLDDVGEVLLTGGQVLGVDVLSLERRKEELDGRGCLN